MPKNWMIFRVEGRGGKLNFYKTYWQKYSDDLFLVTEYILA